MHVEVVPVDVRTRSAATAFLGVALDLEEKAQGVARVQVGVEQVAREVVRIRLAVHGAVAHAEARVVLETLAHVAAERQVHAAVRVQWDELERVQPVGALGRIAQVGVILLVAQDVVGGRLRWRAAREPLRWDRKTARDSVGPGRTPPLRGRPPTPEPTAVRLIQTSAHAGFHGRARCVWPLAVIGALPDSWRRGRDRTAGRSCLVRRAGAPDARAVP